MAKRSSVAPSLGAFLLIAQAFAAFTVTTIVDVVRMTEVTPQGFRDFAPASIVFWSRITTLWS